MSLKSLREEAHLSQSELGSRLYALLPEEGKEPKFFQPRISSYESGRNRIPLPVAAAMVQVLNKALRSAGVDRTVSAEDLLHENHKLPTRRTKKKPRH